jgi:Putative Flp pilus-assembly TadE/G-like
MSVHADRHRASRGQSLVIFALIAVVLLAVVGLAVDGGFSYFASDRLERGAMAAALAGVPDMPDFNSAPNDATTAAMNAAAVNNWIPGGANNVTVTVARVSAPAPNPGNLYLNNQLQVTVASDVPVFFMKLLGFGSHRESRTVVAEYLRPITFGQPGSVLGSTQDALGSGNNFYFMRSEGWGTDRGQGDAYGPNPASTANGGWSSSGSTPNIDVHGLNGPAGTEAVSQPPLTLPSRGGQNYQIYVPKNETAQIQVYNPVFAPDNGATGTNALRYNYHEDDGDFSETTVGGAPTGTTCNQGGNVTPSYCVGPSNIQRWPIMSYTVYQSANPFDHTGDLWLTNLRVKSVDGSAGTGNYTIPGTAAAPQSLSTLTDYHKWVDVQAAPFGAQAATLSTFGATTGPIFNGGAADGLPGGPNGTTYRLRVDQLDSNSSDPGANGLAQNQNSQAHKGYAVRTLGCGGTPPTTCTVTALDDITLYTPIAAGTFSMPLVSIPPEYAGHDFNLYIYDPGDVAGNSNVLTVSRPTSSGGQTTADTTDGVFSGDHGEGTTLAQAAWTNKVAGGSGTASIQTVGSGGSHLYNGLWIRFDITVPLGYASDVDPLDSSTWFWDLNYTTAQPAGDTITANLGFAGAPVHIVKG